MAWTGGSRASSSSRKEKDEWVGETRPWSRFVTVNSCPAGTGKSLAVGVGYLFEIGETLLPRMGEMFPPRRIGDGGMLAMVMVLCAAGDTGRTGGESNR